MTFAHVGGWTAGAWIPLFIFLAILVVGLTFGLAQLSSRHAPGRAREILDERLARGEIGPKEHTERWALLRQSSAHRSLFGPLALVLAVVGLAGTVVVAAVAPGSGHGFMHMMGGMRSMMSGDAGRSGSPPAAGAREIRITGREFSFEPSEVRVGVGETVNVAFDNRGMMFHTLTIGGLGLDLRANGGDSISGSLRPEGPGSYSFICAVAGHADAGMRGTIEVE